MSVIRVGADDGVARLEISRGRLERAAPDLSARQVLAGRQATVLVVLAVVVLGSLVLWPMATLTAGVAVCIVTYLATVAQRIAISVLSARTDSVLAVSDADARAVPAADLPIYTVLVPAYREPEVIDPLLTHLAALEYPADRLDVKLLLEADDTETVERALRHPAAGSIDVVLVPAGEPRTKPKALNYGLTLARGELVTIYDAEDEPDPLQLRRAVVAFDRAGDDVGCLQAQLTYRNPDQNIITRWFTVEYLMWFTLFLPGLSRIDAPVPLGGTSNHIRRRVLEGLGGWDPYNVTEDADLGIRLHRTGWRSAVLGSVTYEEANSDFVNWMKQRSRWYKGYLQTWLVHLRHPVRLWRELGPRGFVQFNLFVGGTPILALLNPIFWAMAALWFLGHFTFIADLFPGPIYYAGLFAWAVGNLSVLYLTVLAARRAQRPSLVLAALLVPLYWVMMSLSAVKAAIQLVAQPSFWEKTTHGLDGTATGVVAGPVGDGGEAVAVDADPMAEGAWGAPALEVAAARSVTTRRHLVSSARVLRGFGLLAIGFVVWMVVGTGVVAAVGASGRAHDARAARPAHVVVAAGTPIATVDASRTGLSFTVLEGTGHASLDRGVGRASASAAIGTDGNAVLVGHRRTAGGPLRDLDRLRRGDRLVARTGWGRATYEVRQVATVAAPDADLDPSGAAHLTILTNAGRGRWTQAQARLVTSTVRGAPAPADGYPALPGADPVALAWAVLWGALALAGWSARGALGRRWGTTAATVLVAPIGVGAVLLGYQAAGHAIAGAI